MLTKAQERALSKLTTDWKCAYDTGVSLNTLMALKRKGLVDHSYNQLTVRFSPRISHKFKKKN